MKAQGHPPSQAFLSHGLMPPSPHRYRPRANGQSHQRHSAAEHDLVQYCAILSDMNAGNKVSLARGARGFLLRSIDSAGCSRYFFRVYDADHSFHDYELMHYDLEVEIVDEEATFYEAEE